MVALFAGLAMVAGVLTVTQLASSALDERNGGLGASECETTAPPEEEADEGAEDEGAAEDADGAAEEAPADDAQPPDADVNNDGLTSADELEPVVVEEAGTEHTHYVPRGWGDWYRRRHGDHGNHRPRPRPTTPPAEETTPPAECEEPTDDPTGDPTSDPTGDPTSDPTGDPTSDPTGDPTSDPTGDPTGEPTEEPTETTSPEPPDPRDDPEFFRGDTCEQVAPGLALHTGFQSNDAQCVPVDMGVVPQVQNAPSLIISDAPVSVAAGEPFSIFVSTRNLVRDFFPGAAAGGYYINSSFLNDAGLLRAHFHTACVEIVDPAVPPTPDELLNPAFFVATEDGGGAAAPDTVEVPVANGLPDSGTYRCTSWAGDASHRPPLMNFARMQGAWDTVRITVE